MNTNCFSTINMTNLIKNYMDFFIITILTGKHFQKKESKF